MSTAQLTQWYLPRPASEFFSTIGMCTWYAPWCSKRWPHVVWTCREVSDSRTLLQSGDWHETSYDWATVSIAQQLRTKLAAASQKRVLFLIVAADFPKHHVPFRRMQAVPSMTATTKLMGVLPLFHGAIVRLTRTILPPELVPEREGKIIGIELNEADHKNFAATPIFSEGAFTSQYLPRTIWVQFDDLSWELIDPMPCSQHQILGADRACNACRFFKGVVGITPVEAHWTFKEKTCGPRLPPLNVDVRRVQFPLAPALPKTIYALQGQTCEPGLVCHVALPKKLSEEARWLSYYVMLSRVRDLQSLHLVGKVNRSILEGGPPARLQDAMENLFEKKMEATMAAWKAAREELQWPARAFTRWFVHCFLRIPRHPTLLPQLFLVFFLVGDAAPSLQPHCKARWPKSTSILKP